MLKSYTYSFSGYDFSIVCRHHNSISSYSFHIYAERMDMRTPPQSILINFFALLIFYVIHYYKRVKRSKLTSTSPQKNYSSLLCREKKVISTIISMDRLKDVAMVSSKVTLIPQKKKKVFCRFSLHLWKTFFHHLIPLYFLIVMHGWKKFLFFCR